MRRPIAALLLVLGIVHPISAQELGDNGGQEQPYVFSAERCDPACNDLDEACVDGACLGADVIDEVDENGTTGGDGGALEDVADGSTSALGEGMP